jgi:hypothetical protein
VDHQCSRGGRRDRLRLDLFDRAHAGAVPAGGTDHPADGPQARRTCHLECVGFPICLRARIPLGEGFLVREQVSADERTSVPVRVYVHVADDLHVAEPFPLPVCVAFPVGVAVPVGIALGVAFSVAIAFSVGIVLPVTVALPVTVNIDVDVDVDEPVTVHSIGFSRVTEHALVRVTLDAGAPRVRSRG